MTERHRSVHPWRCTVATTAVLVACVALLVGAPAAVAAPPHPRVVARAAKDPVFAKRLKGILAAQRAKGIDAPRRVRGKQAVGVSRAAKGATVAGSAADASASSGTSPRLVSTPPGPNLTLALVVDFSDQTAATSAEGFDRLLFEETVGPASVRGYYREVSLGKVDIVTSDTPSSVGWLRMPQTYSYYVGGPTGDGTGAYPNNAQKMVEDAVAAADPLVDFSKYDVDGDRYVDGLMVIHAGSGAEFSGDPGNIWSHAWETRGDVEVDGVYVRDYSTMPEFWQTPGDMTIGVYVHEMGHTFGLPDLYDYGYDSHGAGNWSLMAGGSWSGPGRMGSSPARPDAYCLAKLRFTTPTVVTATLETATIPAVDTTSSGAVHRIEPQGGSGGNEYWLIENRRARGTDAYAPGSGLLIWHIDEDVADNDDQTRYRVDLEEAHGGIQNLTVSPFLAGSNGGDAGDPFPGTSDKTAFSDATDPSSRANAGSFSGIDVGRISASDVTMTARIAIVLEVPDLVSELVAPQGTILPGGSGTLEWRVRNLGSGPAGASASRIVFSSDPVADGGDTLLGTPGVGVLPAGGSIGATMLFSVPATASPGQAYLIATADTGGAVVEVDEANNSVAVPMTVATAMPDLAPGIVSMSGASYPGGPVTVSWTVSNPGSAGAPASSVRVIYSSNVVLDAGDAVLATNQIGALGPGDSVQQSSAVRLPASAAQMQTGQVFVVADADAAIAESDETNNATSRPIYVSELKRSRFRALYAPSRARTSRVSIRSRLVGPRPGARVAVQVYDRGWRTRAYVRTRTGGYVRNTVRLRRADRGRRRIRLVYPAASGYRSAVSRTVLVRLI